jgi:hypothetical protein
VTSREQRWLARLAARFTVVPLAHEEPGVWPGQIVQLHYCHLRRLTDILRGVGGL